MGGKRKKVVITDKIAKEYNKISDRSPSVRVTMRQYASLSPRKRKEFYHMSIKEGAWLGYRDYLKLYKEVRVANRRLKGWNEGQRAGLFENIRYTTHLDKYAPDELYQLSENVHIASMKSGKKMLMRKGREMILNNINHLFIEPYAPKNTKQGWKEYNDATRTARSFMRNLNSLSDYDLGRFLNLNKDMKEILIYFEGTTSKIAKDGSTYYQALKLKALRRAQKKDANINDVLEEFNARLKAFKAHKSMGGINRRKRKKNKKLPKKIKEY